MEAAQPYLGHLLSVLATLGGFAFGMIKLYNALDRRLQKIETRAELDIERKPERDRATRLEMADIARGVCREQTNPGIQLPSPE